MVKKDLSNYLSQFSQLSIRLVAIGGTALVLRGIKTATLDLDFVVQNEEDYRKLLDYSANLGYMAKAYEEGWTRLKGPVVIEIFLKQVQGVRISERMISRCSKDLLKFGKFEILPLHPQDVFILKAVAGREPKDLEDMKTIIEKKCINWEQLVEEIKMLLEEGASTRVVLSTGYWLEKLKNTEKLEIPDQLLDKLWNLLP
ncbi:MAG: nucleotidyltransferase [Candidatus Freyarchaeota archaeon]|nr:nucleotidyltransferase [Candidatus Jordarchaeia archaeon]MBS7267300.1 nucleotidyltransferase [Candidatus Jordarchaeia archaeon]MBS7278268.1 nucleotidyltransferase [Candidatus Jordarchaeia archaeon]